MLYDYYKYFLNYLVYLYGGSYKVYGHFLWIYSGNDIFKVSLLDGSRFNKFTFFHQNYKAKIGNFHKQLECRDLEYGLFQCFTHDFNIKYDLRNSKEDYKKFKEDALKYKMLDEGDTK